MKSKIIIALLLLATLALAGWERTYGGSYGDYCTVAAQTADGGFIVAGNTNSFGGGEYPNIYLLRLDENGDTLWTRTYYHEGPASLASLVITSDGGYLLCCVKNGWYYPHGIDIYLIKTNSSGDTLWTKTYGGLDDDYGNDLIEFSGGGYFVCGYTKSFSSGDYDVYLLRLDLDGDTIWTRTYGSDLDDHAYAIRETYDNKLIITGTVSSLYTSSDIFLLKVDGAGDSLWSYTYGYIYTDEFAVEYAHDVIQTSDSGFIIAGGGTNPDEYYDFNSFLVKTDSVGSFIWTYEFGDYHTDCASAVVESEEGDFIIYGAKESTTVTESRDLYLLKIDSGGDTLWCRYFGGDDSDTPATMLQTADGGYILSAFSSSFGLYDDIDIYLIKTDSLGYTGIEENPPSTKPEAFAISAYPNPFNSAVSIIVDCHSRENGNPEIEIYDINGRIVTPTTPLDRGEHGKSPLSKGDLGGLFVWSPAPSLGSGVYLVRATVGEQTATRRVVYLK